MFAFKINCFLRVMTAKKKQEKVLTFQNCLKFYSHYLAFIKILRAYVRSFCVFLCGLSIQFCLQFDLGIIIAILERLKI